MPIEPYLEIVQRMHTVYERGGEISAQTCHQIYHMAILDDNLPITNVLKSR